MNSFQETYKKLSELPEYLLPEVNKYLDSLNLSHSEGLKNYIVPDWQKIRIKEINKNPKTIQI